jgi:hypothetical protein
VEKLIEAPPSEADLDVISTELEMETDLPLELELEVSDLSPESALLG